MVGVQVEIARLDIGSRRRSVLGYAVGMALYSLVVVALYPAFKSSTSLDKLIRDDPTGAALFGVTGNLTSSGGWLNGNIYANFLPLVMLLLTIGYGAAALAGQDEDGTLCLIATLPLRRDAIVLQKVAALTLLAAVLAVAVAACVAVGRSFELTTSFANIASSSVAVLLLGVDFGILALAVGALTGRRGTAIGVASAVAAASYLVSSLAPVVSWLGPAKYASLFYWSVADNQVTTGMTIGDYAVLLGAGLCALYAAIIAFRRLDLR
jgi:ABC-2 type transport system permease protein